MSKKRARAIIDPYEYRITVQNVDNSQVEFYRYNGNLAAVRFDDCKYHAEVSAITLERREMGSDTFETVSTWQRIADEQEVN